MNRKYRKLFAEWAFLAAIVFVLIPAGVFAIKLVITLLAKAPLDIDFWITTATMMVLVPTPLAWILKDGLQMPYYKKRPRFRHGYVRKNGQELWYVEEESGRVWEEVKRGLPDQESAIAFIEEQYRVWTEEYGEPERVLGSKVFE